MEETKYETWKIENAEQIIEIYLEDTPEAPSDIYEQVLDDDYPDTYDAWAEDLTIEDIPEDILKEAWRIHNEE